MTPIDKMFKNLRSLKAIYYLKIPQLFLSLFLFLSKEQFPRHFRFWRYDFPYDLHFWCEILKLGHWKSKRNITQDMSKRKKKQRESNKRKKISTKFRVPCLLVCWSKLVIAEKVDMEDYKSSYTFFLLTPHILSFELSLRCIEIKSTHHEK